MKNNFLLFLALLTAPSMFATKRPLPPQHSNVVNDDDDDTDINLDELAEEARLARIREENFMRAQQDLADLLRDDQSSDAADTMMQPVTQWACIECGNPVSDDDALDHMEQCMPYMFEPATPPGTILPEQEAMPAQRERSPQPEDGGAAAEAVSTNFVATALGYDSSQDDQPIAARKKSFPNLGDLQQHKRIHSGEKNYECQICNKIFKNKSTLTIHERTHTGEQPYQCKICCRNFTQNTHLKQHERTHGDQKTSVCTFVKEDGNSCNKAFVRARDLTKHMRTHTGEKPYQCATCEKTFKNNSDLRRHERTHTGERPHKCLICGASFTQKAHLKYHQKRQFCGRGITDEAE